MKNEVNKEELIYIPEEVINQNYKYYFNGDYIRIITNKNCTQNYNSTYCDCYDYNFKENILSESITCNTNTNYPKINNEKITQDINYNKTIKQEWNTINLVNLSMIILAILIVTFLTKERTSY